MHDELKKNRNYAPWAIAVGAILIAVSIMFKTSNPTDMNPAQTDTPTTTSDMNVLIISEEMVDAMVNTALSENPSLRENMPTLREQIKLGVTEQEIMVAEAIDRGLASSDPIARNRLRELIIFSIYQEADIGVTPEAIRQYYDTYRDKYFMPDLRRMQHLFVRVTNVTDSEKAAETLEKLFKEAKGPESKQSIAVKNAIKPVVITISEIRMSFGPTYAELVFAEPEGDWSEPIESSSGWHRIRIVENIPSRYREFEEVEAEVESDLRKKLRQDVYRKELERLSFKYKVIFKE